MSGQWEVVGKKKDKLGKSNIPKATKNNNKKPVINGPKVEDVLPMSQVKNLFTASNNKNKVEPQKTLEKRQENNVKKPPKKQDEPVKPKPAKSIESALSSINADDFKSHYENTKLLFPGAPLVWLKELSQILNLKLTVDIQDPTFSNKREKYPLNIVPEPIRKVIETSVLDADANTKEVYFHIALTTMTTNMGKNLPSMGNKIYLQHIAISEPKLVVKDINKIESLMNSYQNRQNIGLSILWAVGQSGISNFDVGFTVFRDIMLPHIEKKNYTKFVVRYIVNLINKHDKHSLTKEQYVTMMDVIFSDRKNFPVDLSQDLLKILPKIKNMLFSENSNEKHHKFVDVFLAKLQKISNNKLKNELCEVLVNCLLKDSVSFGSWTKCYTKYLAGSAILLNYIDINWKTLVDKFNKKVLRDILNTFSNTNEELMLKKRKEEGLIEATDAIKRLENRLAVKNKSAVSTKTFLFFIFLAISSLVIYDIKQHGDWQNSKTSKTLTDIGFYEYASKANDRAKQGLTWAGEKIEEQFPGYLDKISVYLTPYRELSYDLYLVACNAVEDMTKCLKEKYPILVDNINKNMPDLIHQLKGASENALSAVSSRLQDALKYLQEKVFVGQLEPKNMQKVIMEVLNTTQQKAMEGYLWLAEKCKLS